MSILKESNWLVIYHQPLLLQTQRKMEKEYKSCLKKEKKNRQLGGSHWKSARAAPPRKGCSIRRVTGKEITFFVTAGVIAKMMMTMTKTFVRPSVLPSFLLPSFL